MKRFTLHLPLLIRNWRMRNTVQPTARNKGFLLASRIYSGVDNTRFVQLFFSCCRCCCCIWSSSSDNRHRQYRTTEYGWYVKFVHEALFQGESEEGKGDCMIHGTALGLPLSLAVATAAVVSVRVVGMAAKPTPTPQPAGPPRSLSARLVHV